MKQSKRQKVRSALVEADKRYSLADAVKIIKQVSDNKYDETDKDWQNFSRLENADTRYKDASLRHMAETGIIDDMIEYGEMTHEAAVVWNSLADLEVKLGNHLHTKKG